MDIDEAPRHGRRRLTREEGGPTVWISIARLVRQPGQSTSSHGIPATTAAGIVGDHHMSQPCESWLRMGPGDEAATGMACPLCPQLRVNCFSAVSEVMGQEPSPARQDLAGSHAASTAIGYRSSKSMRRRGSSWDLAARSMPVEQKIWRSRATSRAQCLRLPATSARRRPGRLGCRFLPRLG